MLIRRNRPLGVKWIVYAFYSPFARFFTLGPQYSYNEKLCRWHCRRGACGYNGVKGRLPMQVEGKLCSNIKSFADNMCSLRALSRNRFLKTIEPFEGPFDHDEKVSFRIAHGLCHAVIGL